MIIKCDKSDLVTAIRTAMRAVPSKTTMPILECVLIEAKDSGITITANNTEMGIVTTLDGEVAESGISAIDAKLLNEISGKLSAGTVTISVNEDLVCTIKAGKSKFEIPCKDPDMFIRLPETENGLTIEVDQVEFRNAVQKSIFCTTQNESNAMMTGEHVEVDGNILRLTALDGHRVAITEVALERDYPYCETIIPATTLSEIAKILKVGYLWIEFSENHTVFTFGNTKMISRTIGGKYFNVKQMLRGDTPIVMKVDAGELLSCIDRASVVIDAQDKKPIVVTITDDLMQIDSNTAKGNVNEELPVEKNGDDIRIGFNCRFLAEAVSAAYSYDDELQMSFSSAKSPVYITKPDAYYKYIVLPVNI